MGKSVFINGWSPDRDLADMLAHAGTRKSSECGGDSDAWTTDPVRTATSSRPVGYEEAVSALEAAWALYLPGHSLQNYMAGRALACQMALVAGTLLAVAAKTTNKDVVVIFGRDMYPAQAFLRVWARQLRGTWIYVEGVSRAVVRESRKAVCALVYTHLLPGGRVFGVDTGFTGSIPDAALEGYNPVVILASSNNARRRAFGRIDGYRVRNAALRLEHQPKPFMRAIWVGEDGLPKLAMSRPKDIVRSAAIYMAAWAMARDMAPTLGVRFRQALSPDDLLLSYVEEEPVHV